MGKDLSEFAREVLRLVHSCLEPHGGASAAEVDCNWIEGFGGWSVEVRPHRDGAAPVSVLIDGSELVLFFGRTRTELWDTKRGQPPLQQLARLLPAIFDGSFDEAGRGDDRFARIRLGNGEVVSTGAMHLPIPWRLRQQHRYLSYSQRHN